VTEAPVGLPTIDELWDYSDPAASETRFRDLAAAAISSGQTSYAEEALTQVARTLGLQQEFDEGHAVLDRCAPGGGESLSGRARIRFHLERGRLVNSGGDAPDARSHFLSAWDAAVEYGDDCLAVDAAHMLGIVEPGDDGRKWNERAIELAESSADPQARLWRASLLNNQGWDAYDDADYPVALALFERALAARRESGASEPSTRIARWCVAKGLRSVGRVDEAFIEQTALALENPEPDGYNHEELGECLLALGRASEARDHFAEAYLLLSKDPWLAESDPKRLARMEELGRAP
jgi:tetratricopeptide (TPR) repeat protein